MANYSNGNMKYSTGLHRESSLGFGGPAASKASVDTMSVLNKERTPSNLGNDLHADSDLPLSALGGLEPRKDRDRRLSMSSTYSMLASQYAQTGGLLGPKRPRPHKIWRKKFIKVLVVGDSGLGKTTLIKSLMSTPGERLQVHDGSYTPSEQFFKDPESLCSTISWRDEEDRVIWVYKIQDTPGYGDDLDMDRSVKAMLDYIEDQNRRWLALEQSKDRKEDLADLEDPRVDVCIFCIPPHRLRAIDLKFMYELGRAVPVVPVVTKADTMTIREASMYRTEVANKISNPMVAGIKDKINIFKFERDTLDRSGIQDAGTPIPPFLVIASNDINEELNASEAPVFWPERRYPWGTAEAFNRDHSDLLSLRALLLKEALEEINKTKRSRYENWRRRALNSNRLGRKLLNMMFWTIIPAAICLQIGRKGVNMDDVRRMVRKTYSNVTGRVQRSKRHAAAAPAPVLAPEPEPAPPPPPPPPAPEPKKKGWFQ